MALDEIKFIFADAGYPGQKAGTIIGTGGTAIEFAGSGNTLTLGAGYQIDTPGRHLLPIVSKPDQELRPLYSVVPTTQPSTAPGGCAMVSHPSAAVSAISLCAAVLRKALHAGRTNP